MMITLQNSTAPSMKQDRDFLLKSFSNVKNTYNFHVVLRSFIRDSYSIYFLYALIFWSVMTTCGNDIRLDCNTDHTITSPDYPSFYPNDASEEWFITAPSQRRILVTFNDFNLEDPWDTMDVKDIMYTDNAERYTGEKMIFPPFLTQGNSVQIEFTSSETHRRTGFSISVSCNEISIPSSVRVVEGTSPSEGFLELRSQTGEWMRVCEDNLPDQVAKVICGELGYPGVKEISYENSTCLSDDLEGVCTRAPDCPEKTYRVEDCPPEQSKCSSDMVVRIKCYEPGFKGCYDFTTRHLQNGFTFTSTGWCITSCKTSKNQAIAVMNHVKCFCTTIAEAQLMDRNMCSDETELTAKMLVYNVSEGFCDELNDTVGGSWDSNITWFGSIVHLTCMDGYTLNGNGTLQCVPGSTPYYPVWNDSVPFCILNVSPTGLHKHPIIAGSITISILILVVAVVLVVFFKFYRKRGESCQSWKRPGQADESRSSHTYSGGRAVATDSRRHQNSPSRRITNDSTSATLVIPFALSDNLSQDSRSSEALPPLPPLHPSDASNRPFGFLHQNNPPSENHYTSSDSDTNPYYYASSFENQRADSARPDEPHDEEQYTMGNVNHAYEETDDQGQSNATLQNINPYHYASSFDTAKVPYTFATDHEEGYQEPSTVDIVNRPYEGTIEQGQSNTTLGNRIGVGLTMISRPLPHRPTSSNCNEGPTPPPRKTLRASRNDPPAPTTLGQKISENVSENNNFLIGACSSDFSGRQNLLKKHTSSNKRSGKAETRLHNTLKKDKQKRKGLEKDNVEKPTPIRFQGDIQDPKDGNNRGSDSGLSLHDVPVSINSQDSTDMTDSLTMIDNVLYIPMQSCSRIH